MRRGLYRVHGTGGRPDDVRVEDNGIDSPMEEHLYRARGYLPLVDELPWQDGYFSKGPSAASGLAIGGATETEKAARERARREFRARFDKA